MQRTKGSILHLSLAALIFSAIATAPRPAAADPWADSVVFYNSGTNPEAGYTGSPGAVLGSPERVTGENFTFPFPSDVTMFNGPFGFDEIVSIGAGGELIVQFDEPIDDDPAHPFGVDLIIFGNTFFATDDFTVGNILGHTGEPAFVDVSADGMHWEPLGALADTLFPTQAWTDAQIFGTDVNGEPSGTIPTDFLKPMDPSLSIDDFLGLTYAEALALYDGSGGGTPVDIAASGLASVSYVRIRVPEGATHSAEIDAFAAVPEPGAGLLSIGAFSLTLCRRARRR